MDFPNSESELTGLVREFVEHAANELDDGKLAKKEVAQLTGNGAYADFKAVQRPSISMSVVDSDISQSSESGRLLKHIESEGNFSPTQTYLINILNDVFGKEGRYLTNWEERIDRTVNKIEADLNGFSQFRVKCVLRGVKIEEGFEIDDNFRLCEFSQGDVIGEEIIPDDPGAPVDASRTLNYDCYAEIDVRQDNLFKNRPRAAAEFHTTVLSLASRSLVGVQRMYVDPLTYRGMNTTTPSSNDGSTSPLTTHTADSADIISPLKDLLLNYYNPTNMKISAPTSFQHNFQQPINTALKHYGESLVRHDLVQTSITFSIVGLESLYKQHTEGKTSAKDVAMYAGYLIGMVSENLDPKDVLGDIKKAYDYRNQWAHGQYGNELEKELQRNTLNHLRSSIVLFAWMDNHTSLLNPHIDLESKLIDDRERESLKRTLEPFDLHDYIELIQGPLWPFV